MATIDIDVEYLNVSKLAYAFEGLSSSDEESLKQEALEVAIKALEIMNRYQTLHPSYMAMIDYVSNSNTIFTHEWAASIERTNKALVSQYTDELHNCLQDADKASILQNIKKLSSIYAIQGNFQQFISTLNQFNSAVQFKSQPNDINEFTNNKYIEFNFYQYTANLYSLIWFPLSKESNSRVANSHANAVKTVNNYFKKVDLYYNKNEMLINIDNSSTEVQYYWLMRWLNLTLHFKQGKFDDFLSDFNMLISCDSALSPLDILNNNETVLKTEILIMFKISILITKPFKNLSLLNYEISDHETTDNEILFDLFSNTNKFEFTIHEVCLNLAESNFKAFKESYDKAEIRKKLMSVLGYAFPRDPLVFIEFIDNVVNFKNFLLIITISKKIPRSKMMSFLGCSNETTNILILFMSILKLGELGIGYDYNGGFFYNSGIKNRNLDEQISNLENRLVGESIAHLIKGCLIEQALDS